MARTKKSRVLRMMFCDFCGADQGLRAILIRGRDEVHICDQCVAKCAEMVIEEHRKQELALEPTEPGDPGPTAGEAPTLGDA